MVEPSQEDLETPAGERPSESEGLGSLDSNEVLGSSDQQTSEIPEPPLSELEPTQEKVSQPSLQQPSLSETSEIQLQVTPNSEAEVKISYINYT
jgi:hypothetical protein